MRLGRRRRPRPSRRRPRRAASPPPSRRAAPLSSALQPSSSPWPLRLALVVLGEEFVAVLERVGAVSVFLLLFGIAPLLRRGLAPVGGARLGQAPCFALEVRALAFSGERRRRAFV